jgi:general secretion pathway protein G
MDNNRYPTQEEGLAALITRPADAATWPPGGYVDMRAIPRDPWNRPYMYSVETDAEGNETPIVMTYGKDGAPGGQKYNADIINGDVMDESAAPGGGPTP